jgi:hypothetical protein
MRTSEAGPDGSELSERLGLLPAPDLQADPCSADGTQTDYYTAGTVRRLLAAERERWVKHLRDMAAGHQRAADMTDNRATEQRHDAMSAALLASIEGPNKI